MAVARAVTMITGAGSGIGRSACIRLGRAGHRLCLVGRTESKLLETVELMAEQAPQASETLIVPADVSDSQQAASAVDQTLERWGRVDALVNNAAIVHLNAIDQVDEAIWFQTFASNVFGAAYLTARLWPVFVTQRQARVVNVSSMSAHDPFPGLAAYAASKAALESLTRSIMAEGRPHGILAFSVAPGAVETAMLRGLWSEADLPRERTLDPDAVAGLIAECVAGRRDAQAGQTLRLASP